MATYFSTFAWKIPWTEEQLGYSPRGGKESDTTEQLHFTHFTFYHWSRKWQPTPVFCLEERSLAGHGPWGRRVGHN